MDGTPGGDTTIADQDGNVLLRAPGGVAVLAGTGIRSTSEHLGVSVLTLAHYVQVRGVVDLMGGGWDSFFTLNLGDEVTLAVLVILEAGGVTAGEYAVAVEACAPDERRFGVQFPVTVEAEGDVLRIARFCHLPVVVSAFGLWQFSVTHGGKELAAIDLIVKRTGEADT